MKYTLPPIKRPPIKCNVHFSIPTLILTVNPHKSHYKVEVHKSKHTLKTNQTDNDNNNRRSSNAKGFHFGIR